MMKKQMQTNMNDARIEWPDSGAWALIPKCCRHRGGNPRIDRMVEPRFQPENKENRFLWVFSFYDANRNKYENEWDDDDNDNKTR